MDTTPQAFGPENTRQKGYAGEDAAVDFLLSLGYSIISRNYQARRGEIDCIAEDPSGTLIFCEVKSAKSSLAGHPAFWVTRDKQRKIIRMAQRYLAEHGFNRRPCRFDVVTVYNGKIEHYKNAFFA
jgi:putative endonuclease